MNRIDKKFKSLKQQNGKALVAFITAGDPDIETSLDIITAAIKAGVDIIELGVPFSDPTADGPVIQRASMRALKAGVNITAVLDMVRRLRQNCGNELPIVLFSYYNPILRYGVKKFGTDAVDAGADAVLLVDLPFEEKAEFEQYAPKLPIINLVAPTTNGERLDKICKDGKGFIYMINRVGITGTGGVDSQSVQKMAQNIKSRANVPVCMGFGVSSPQDAASIAPFADGVVVGSLFEKLIEENINSPDLPKIVALAARELKEAIG